MQTSGTPQAIADAIDPTAVRDAVVGPDFKVATSILASTTPGYLNLSSEISYDPSAAEQILTKAGWVAGPGGVREKDGQKLALTLGWFNDYAPNQSAVQLIQAELGQVGISLSLLTGSAAAYLTDIQSGKFALVWGQASEADPGILKEEFSDTEENYFNVKNATLETYYDEIYDTSNTATQDAAAAAAQKLILSEHYAVPVFEQSTVVAVVKAVHGFSLDAESLLPALTDVWLS
jgi:peptide/nickel transport system substrate-binding protein